MGLAASALSMTEASAVASAWAPAAALASLATLGANAAPAAAGITSTVGLSQGIALAGMRKNGGQVQAGGLYGVGESNLPELLQTNNGLFMIPGSNGRVFSNKDITSGAPTIPRASTGSEYLKAAKSQGGMASDASNGGASLGKTIININNYSSANVQAQSSQQSGNNVIDILIDDGERGGP